MYVLSLNVFCKSGVPTAQGLKSFQIGVQVSFQYQLKGKDLVQASSTHIQNGHQNPRWLPIYFSLSLITFVLLNFEW